MNTSYSQQITAIQKARTIVSNQKILSLFSMTIEERDALMAELNDGGATITSLNLTKNIDKAEDNAVEMAMLISGDVITTIEKVYS